MGDVHKIISYYQAVPLIGVQMIEGQVLLFSIDIIGDARAERA